MGASERSFITLWILTFLSSQGLSQTIQPFVPDVRTVANGDRVSLNCEVRLTTPGANVAWYHEASIISHGTTLLNPRSNAYDLSGPPAGSSGTGNYHWNLTINSLSTGRDTGTWSCRLELTASNILEQSVELLVLAPPTITYITENHIPSLGSDLTLQCNATGTPTPGVTWARTYPQPYLLLGNNDRRLFARSSGSSTLALSNLNSDHRGRYVCTAANGGGEPVDGTTYIQLPYAPEVQASLQRVRVVEGMQAVLACISQAYPATDQSSSVQWLKDDQPIDNSIGSVDVQRHPEDFYGERFFSRLRISSAIADHVGTYTCRFTNTQGTGSATVMLGLEPLIDPTFGAIP